MAQPNPERRFRIPATFSNRQTGRSQVECHGNATATSTTGWSNDSSNPPALSRELNDVLKTLRHTSQGGVVTPPSPMTHILGDSHPTSQPATTSPVCREGGSAFPGASGLTRTPTMRPDYSVGRTSTTTTSALTSRSSIATHLLSAPRRRSQDSFVTNIRGSSIDISPRGSQESRRSGDGEITESFALTNDETTQSGSTRKKGIETFKQKLKNPKALFSRQTENLGDVFGRVRGDLLDITMSSRDAIGAKTDRLCTACSKIPFDQFGDGKGYGSGEDDVKSEVITNLDRVLQNRDWCKFCGLLVGALSVEENDPLKHPAVQNHIQKELEGKTFKEWATRATWIRRTIASQTIWPFGCSCAPVKLDDTNPLRSNPDGKEIEEKD